MAKKVATRESVTGKKTSARKKTTGKKKAAASGAATKPKFKKVPGSSAYMADARWQCHHCKDWIDANQPHDCWTTTEAALTADLSEDLREAWERFREAAVDCGPQRIYASGTAIMFSRRVSHFFVRPKRSFLEVCIFLGRTVRSPLVKRSTASSRTKVAHIIQLRHRDQVEAPLTDWLAEAYELSV